MLEHYLYIFASYFVIYVWICQIICHHYASFSSLILHSTIWLTGVSLLFSSECYINYITNSQLSTKYPSSRMLAIYKQRQRNSWPCEYQCNFLNMFLNFGYSFISTWFTHSTHRMINWTRKLFIFYHLYRSSHCVWTYIDSSQQK